MIWGVNELTKNDIKKMKKRLSAISGHTSVERPHSDDVGDLSENFEHHGK